jgi:hypothetical protein
VALELIEEVIIFRMNFLDTLPSVLGCTNDDVAPMNNQEKVYILCQDSGLLPGIIAYKMDAPQEQSSNTDVRSMRR